MKKIDDIDKLSQEEQLEIAFEKVMRSVSIREQSSKKIIHKLKSCGLNDEVIDKTIDRAIRCSAIDDIRYCECLIRTAIKSNKGLVQVLREIEELNIDPNELEAYQNYLSEDEDIKINRALDVLYRHPPRSKNIREGAFRKLISKGYSTSFASKVSKAYVDSLA